jgi:hypothetical protein
MFVGQYPVPGWTGHGRNDRRSAQRTAGLRGADRHGMRSGRAQTGLAPTASGSNPRLRPSSVCRSISRERRDNGWNGAIEGPYRCTARRLPPDAGNGGRGERSGKSRCPSRRMRRSRSTRLQTVEFDGEASLPLAALPGAASQVGTVTIRSPEALPLQFAVQNVRAIPANRLPPDVRAPREPSTATIRRRTAASPIQHSPEAIAPYGLGLVVRSGDPPLSGRENAARGRVPGRGRGAAQMKLTTPEPVEWLSARIDGREVPLAWKTPTFYPGEHPLAAGRSFSHRAGALRHAGQTVASFRRNRCGLARLRSTDLSTELGGVAAARIGKSCPAPLRHPRILGQRRLLGSLLDHRTSGRLRRGRPTAGRRSCVERTNRTCRLGWQDVCQMAGGAVDRVRTVARFGHRAVDDYVGRVTANLAAGRRRGRQPSAEVWIDQLALGAEGSGHSHWYGRRYRTPGRARLESSAGTAQGVSLLTAAGLALLIDGNRLRVTTVRGLFDRTDVIICPDCRTCSGCHKAIRNPRTEHPDNLRWIRLESMDRTTSVATSLLAAFRNSHAASFGRDSPGTAVGRPADFCGTFPGIPSDSTRERAVTVYQPLVIRSLGWAALLAAMGLTVWMVRGRLPLAWPLAGLAGIATLLSPALWTPVFQGVFVGTLLGGCWLWCELPVGWPRIARGRK